MGDIFQNGEVFNSGSVWQISDQNNNDIYYNNGNIGIGTAAPEQMLHLFKNIAGGGEAKICIRMETSEYDQSGISGSESYYVWDTEANKNTFSLSFDKEDDQSQLNPEEHFRFSVNDGSPSFSFIHDEFRSWAMEYDAGSSISSGGMTFRNETDIDGGPPPFVYKFATYGLGVGTEEPLAELHLKTTVNKGSGQNTLHSSTDMILQSRSYYNNQAYEEEDDDEEIPYKNGKGIVLNGEYDHFWKLSSRNFGLDIVHDFRKSDNSGPLEYSSVARFDHNKIWFYKHFHLLSNAPDMTLEFKEGIELNRSEITEQKNIGRHVPHLERVTGRRLL